MTHLDAPMNDAVTVARSCRARTTIAIHGLGCGGGGTLSLERALGRVGGVTRAYVNAATEMAYVEYCPLECQIEDLLTAVRQAGFQGYEHDPHFHG